MKAISALRLAFSRLRLSVSERFWPPFAALRLAFSRFVLWQLSVDLRIALSAPDRNYTHITALRHDINRWSDRVATQEIQTQ